MTTAKPSNIQGVLWEPEVEYAENLTTVTKGLSIINQIDFSGLTWPTEENPTVSPFKHGGCAPLRGIKGGSFTLEMFLSGLGGSGAGAIPAQTEQQEFLRGIIGDLRENAAGTTADGTGSLFQIGANATNFADGSLIRIGEKGDGRGDGQFYEVSTAGGANVNLKTAVRVAPDAGDVIYATRTFYPIEDACNDPVQSYRFMLGSANAVYLCTGCVPTSIEFFDLGIGQNPKVRVTMGVAFWEPQSGVTFPFAGIGACPTPCTVAGGSLYIERFGVGTQTNNVDMREFSFTIGDTVNTLLGTNVTQAFQGTSEAYRTGGEIDVNMTFDADAQGSQLWYDVFDAYTDAYHAIYTVSSVDGCAIAFHFPRLYMKSAPTQADFNGLNSVPVTWSAKADTAETGDLPQSAWRLGIG